jgi:hypothetical protein
MRNSALLLSLLIGCTSEQMTKTINDAPTVAITSHSDGFEVFEGETLSFQAQVLGTSSSFTLDSSFCSPTDTIECSATISDPSGDSDSGSSSVQIQNQAPVIASVSLSPSTVNQQGTIECSASVSDPDDEIPSLAYSWENLTTRTTVLAWVLGMAMSPLINSKFSFRISIFTK